MRHRWSFIAKRVKRHRNISSVSSFSSPISTRIEDLARVWYKISTFLLRIFSMDFWFQPWSFQKRSCVSASKKPDTEDLRRAFLEKRPTLSNANSKRRERRGGNRRDNMLCVYELRDETIPAWSQRVNPISFLQNFQEKFGLRWRSVVRHTYACVRDAGRRSMSRS